LEERAHGDGMLFNVDSPEAFEEVFWKMFWREHYKKDRILPWRVEEHDEFFDFFRGHMRKIIAIRRKDSVFVPRYVSKNNVNIARLDLLHFRFPEALILVPFRRPLQQAASLLRQHQNFIQIHKRDRFARYYMASIGHHDFGENLRPIDFDGWLEKKTSRDPTTLSFWLEYWIAAHGYLLKKAAPNVSFISYEALCEDPERGLEYIADIIGIRERAPFFAQKSRIRPGKPHTVDAENLPQHAIDEADDLYAKLSESSLM
jgi:hypothetical protein